MVDKKILELIDKMTLDEKIGQLNQEGIRDTEELRQRIREGKIGSIILTNSSTAGNEKQQAVMCELLNELERVAVEESRLGIPIIFGRDIIHGHHVVMPIPLATAATFNTDITKKAYRVIAKEASNEGVQWTFSPMIDVSRDPRWGRCVEGFGEDPYLAGKFAGAIIEGFQGDNYDAKESIAACAKHYIGYGAVEGGRDYGKSEISDYTLRNFYLPPFKEAVKSGVATVMSSFNEISGQPVTSSRYLLNDVLKEELGFDGFIVSDWYSIAQLINQGVAENDKDAAMLAANAELDMDMVDKCYINNLSELVSEGKVSEETIDRMVYRILKIKSLFGLFDNPYVTPETIDYEEHKKIAKQCSDEAIVLLKNKNNILPLSKDEKVGFVGPFLHEKRSHLGTWSLDPDISMVSSISEEVRKCSDKAVMADSMYLWDEILMSIKTVDTVVVLLGESFKVTGEACGLVNIELPVEQLEYVKKIKNIGKKVIGVLCFGRPIGLLDADMYFDAILYAWHSGTMASKSIVDILYGNVSPSGRLPMSFPRKTGQVPIYYNYPLLPRDSSNYYDGYSSYHDVSGMPMYPFGYGLSYTTFEYGKPVCECKHLTLDELKNGKCFEISIEVKNTGNVDCKETCQCYVNDKIASMTRPIKELKGFSKKLIPAGETKTFKFKLGFDELAFYNAKGEFVVESGEFLVYVGADCTTTENITICVE